MKDFIVIGAGYSGIATAALLQKAGFSVLILEAHSLIGGCASFFRRKHFLFDAGATTLSGVLPNQPLGKLFVDLEITPELNKLDPGMKILLDGETITRYADFEKWVEEAEKCFPQSKHKQRAFWEKIYSINASAWDFISTNLNLPPSSLKDLILLSKPKNWNKIHLLPKLFFPLRSLLSDLNIKDQKFERFLNEQLLITTQSTLDKAPILTSAMGLAYPSETYYPIGGITKPLELVLEKFIGMGGSILFREEVKSINKINNEFVVQTKKMNEYISKYLVSTIPIWNMEKLTSGSLNSYYKKQIGKFPKGPAAFTMNFGIKVSDTIEGGYYQIHTPAQIPHCEASAFFLTLSKKGDLSRAPSTHRTATISTHTDSEEWFFLNEEEYKTKKQETTDYILETLGSYFPEFKEAQKEFLVSASPKTFQKFTRREQGFVGGIPHSISPSLLRLPPNKLPFSGIFQGGDTAFPGQGTPAVVHGAYQILQAALSLK
jgi:C-3',4' desaturase CrtD